MALRIGLKEQNMYSEQWVLAFSFLGGTVFGVLAGFFREKRLRMVLPSLLLFVVAFYEFRMDRWEKTVHAPIRLDMIFEIPLMITCLAWGVLAIILPTKNRNRDKSIH
jgi:hypothetical protein